jgi:hypothetical protein
LAAVAPSGAIKGLLPLHHIKSRLFGDALVSTAFAVDGGLLVTDDRAIAPLAAAAQDLARDRGGAPLELRGGPAPGGDWQRREGNYVGFVRPLAADDEAELLAVPRKHRAELRKALANPALHIETGRSDALLRDHYHVYATSVRNLGTPVFPAKLFQSVLQQFGEDADLLVVREGDRPVSGRRRGGCAAVAIQRTHVLSPDGPWSRARHDPLRFRPVEGRQRTGSVEEEFRLRAGAAHLSWLVGGWIAARRQSEQRQISAADRLLEAAAIAGRQSDRPVDFARPWLIRIRNIQP